MKILMIVDWPVRILKKDDMSLQSANCVVEGQLYWFFKHWPVEGLDVRVVGRQENRFLDFLEKRLLRFNLSTGRYFFMARSYDLVICFHSQAGVILGLLRWLAGGRGYPPFVLFDVEGLARKCINVLAPLLRIAVHQFALIFYFASVQSADYSRCFPGLAGRTQFLRWGVDLSRYPSMEDESQEDMIVTIGSQGTRFRDWPVLMDAWRRMPAASRTRLVIVGRKNLEDCGVAAEDLAPRVEFVDVLSLAGLNALIGRARFVVLPLPERRHAYGQMTLLGVMALGKAVIVSDVSGIRDCARPMKSAVFHRQGDAQDLAAKMRLLLEEPELARTIGQRARESVHQYYTEKQMGEHVYEWIFRAVFAKRSHGST